MQATDWQPRLGPPTLAELHSTAGVFRFALDCRRPEVLRKVELKVSPGRGFHSLPTSTLATLPTWSSGPSAGAHRRQIGGTSWRRYPCRSWPRDSCPWRLGTPYPRHRAWTRG